MIIDFHTHLAYSRLYPKQLLLEMFDYRQLNFPEKKLLHLIEIFLNDEDGKKHIHQMDLSGVEKSVLLILDCGCYYKGTNILIDEIYQIHYQILKTYPDRFVVFAGIDPRRPDGFEIFKNGIEKYGFRGLKLYPPMGFSIENYKLEPYYEYCNKYNLPVLIHTGPSLDSLQNEFADPLSIRKIAQKYLNLTFILAHAGLKSDDQLVTLINDYSNIFVDISGFQKLESDIFGAYPSNKILFGSDWPLFNLFLPLNKSIESLMHIISKRSIEQQDIENITFKNAKSILMI